MVVTRRPLDFVDVEAGVVAGDGVARPGRLLVAVVRPIRAPVQRRADLLVADVDSVEHQTRVAARLDDVDLARRRPRAVRVVTRKHPNGCT